MIVLSKQTDLQPQIATYSPCADADATQRAGSIAAAANQVNGGQRVATVLMYLSDVEEGEKACAWKQPVGK